MSNLSRREQIMFLLLSVLTILLGSVVYSRFFSPKPQVAFKLDDTPAVSAMAVFEDEVMEEEIMVYVIGAVKNPGVYSLWEGDRIRDAIAIAGGALPDADLVRINLAQRLYDEDKLYVPKIEEGVGMSGEGALGDSFGIISPDDDKVNINTSDKATLETLPGVGPVTSQKIIDYREKNGPYKAIEDIKEISGIGEKKFEELRDHIRVR